MTVRIGFIPPETGASRHLHLFNYCKINGNHGRTVLVGYHRYTRSELQALRDGGVHMSLWALGLISFAPDVSPALTDAVFTTLTVRGWIRNRPTRQSMRP